MDANEILFVDDNKNRHLACVKEAFDIKDDPLTAEDADSAIVLLKERSKDIKLVITDLVLPQNTGDRKDTKFGQKVACAALSYKVGKVICWSVNATAPATPKGAIGCTLKPLPPSKTRLLYQIYEDNIPEDLLDYIYPGEYLYEKDMITAEAHNLRHEILGPLLPLHLSLQSYLAGNDNAFNGNEEYMKGLAGLLSNVKMSMEKFADLKVNDQRLAEIDGAKNSPKNLIEEIQPFLSNEDSLLVQLCKDLKGCTEAQKIDKKTYKSLPEQIDNILACKLQKLVDYVDKQSDPK